MQLSVMHYADGTEVQVEVRGHSTHLDGGVRFGVHFYGTEGWLTLDNQKHRWETYFGVRPNIEPGPVMSRDDLLATLSPRDKVDHFQNFINCMRSRNREDLTADVFEGHLSGAMCHLSNIAYRTGRTLTFDSRNECFPNDNEANSLLRREYRHPFVVAEHV